MLTVNNDTLILLPIGWAWITRAATANVMTSLAGMTAPFHSSKRLDTCTAIPYNSLRLPR